MRIRLTRIQRVQLTVIAVCIGVLGWLAAGGLAVYVGKLKLSETLAERDATRAERDAAGWRRQASKAYTELLVARSGRADGQVLIPMGTRIEGTINTEDHDGRTLASFNGVMFLPPKGY